MNQNPYLSILFLSAAMLVTIVMATLMVVYVRFTSGTPPFVINYEDPFVMAGLIAGIASIPAGLVVFKSLVTKAKQLSIEEDKLRAYRTAIIIRHAIWEASIIVNIVGMWQVGSWLSIIGAGGVIMMFIVNMPNRNRIKSDLELE
jgi:hypothetical protein